MALLLFYTFYKNESNFGKKASCSFSRSRFFIIIHFTFADLPFSQLSSSLPTFLISLPPPIVTSSSCSSPSSFSLPLFFSSSRPLCSGAPGGSRRRVCSAQGLSCYRVLNATETKFLLRNSMCVCVCVRVCVWVPDKYGHVPAEFC